MSAKRDVNSRNYSSGSSSGTSGCSILTTTPAAKSVAGVFISGPKSHSSVKSLAGSVLSQSKAMAKYAKKSAANSLVDGAFRVSKKELNDIVAHCDASREEREKSEVTPLWVLAD